MIEAPTPKTWKQQVLPFAVSGVLGFLTDAAVVWIMTSYGGWGDIPAQLLAFMVAVTVTWLVNRSWTFAEHASERWVKEWLRYTTANSVGAAVNNAVYIVLVLTLSLFSKHPIFAVAAGSVVGMGVNFMASRRLVFRRS
ncbi:GtrA family protein [Acidithiobacillus caldus]|uniref:GtrA family protein n=1 Tax=Acidithiobacillus caldus TaxID=33059 RepID=UPI001C073758|nr:GtrA family protein [Acidithiobacillus caldus]MBU2790022.1 GtrA family protein [Acidithiobacillus caldus]MBU2820835.1 GtrA family protein [Acidithiobacillus caldus]